MAQYWAEFAGLMAVFAVLIVAPGADFALVIRQCVVHGRRTALITSVGIGTSLLFHISYTILGIGIIVSKSLFLFALLKWAGAAYLIWLGVKSWREPAFRMESEDDPTWLPKSFRAKGFRHGLHHQCAEPEARAVLPVAVFCTGLAAHSGFDPVQLWSRHGDCAYRLVCRRVACSDQSAGARTLPCHGPHCSTASPARCSSGLAFALRLSRPKTIDAGVCDSCSACAAGSPGLCRLPAGTGDL